MTRKDRSARRRLWHRIYKERVNLGLEHCRVCGALDNLTFDEITPYVQGGTRTFDNVSILCERCNQKKGGRASSFLRSLEAEEAEAPPERQWVRLAQEAAAAYTPCTDVPQDQVSLG